MAQRRLKKQQHEHITRKKKHKHINKPQKNTIVKADNLEKKRENCTGEGGQLQKKMKT